jgi:hypothetical protein
VVTYGEEFYVYPAWNTTSANIKSVVLVDGGRVDIAEQIDPDLIHNALQVQTEQDTAPACHTLQQTALACVHGVPCHHNFSPRGTVWQF